MGRAELRDFAHSDGGHSDVLEEILGVDLTEDLLAEDIRGDALHVVRDARVKGIETFMARFGKHENRSEGQIEFKRLDHRVLRVFEIEVIDSAIAAADLVEHAAWLAEEKHFGVLASEGQIMWGDFPVVIEVVDDLSDEGFVAGGGRNAGAGGDVAIQSGEETPDFVAKFLEGEEHAFSKG